MSTMTAETYRHRLGTDADGGYVVVDVRLEPIHGDHETITHDTVTGGLRFAISGEHYAKGERRGNPSRAGQCIESLGEIVKPAAGWTLEEIAELAKLWDRWHLNDLRAACSHMKPFPQGARATTEEWANRPTCPDTGYRYGNSWLVEPLPTEVVERVRELMRDRSRDLYRERGYDASGKRVTD